ncbi:serine/threonine-protein kinase [Streptomyces sp. NBC_01190]|uniref:serine/threonine-protein kinase n=1 Tax=Streptomyces sp. NBC_01190 TaxID=2903767 RepID=UPI0038649DA9|nr:serine/threonine protein kinase [Streptomyces sp. NBC_01190]
MSALESLAGRPGPRAGDVLGDRYRLEETLGTGGTADVFRATDLTLRREVAVKVFRPGATAVSADRFCEEAVLLGRLAHPALVVVYDAGRYLGGAYVVMQLVRGVTLRERLDDTQLTSTQVARLGEQLALALAHAHRAGIVHRDVKPSNVLLGPDDVPYLADFGISRLIDEPTRAEPGTVVGTVPYLAPEQVLGKGSSPASDVYSLGLVLLEALKGEREYQGAPLEAGAARLLRPPEIPLWLPEELASLIEEMTRTEPAERPDAKSCAHRLRDAADFRTPRTVFTADDPTHRSQTTVIRGEGRERRRHTRLVAGAAAAVLMAATGTTLLAMQGGGTSAPDADTHHRVPAGTQGKDPGTAPARSSAAEAPPVLAGTPRPTDTALPSSVRGVTPVRTPHAANPPAQQPLPASGGGKSAGASGNGKGAVEHKKDKAPGPDGKPGGPGGPKK